MNHHDELAAIGRRLETLERQNRRLKRFGAAAAAAIACAAFLAASDGGPSVLDAGKLILRDSEGRVRCQVEVDDQGGVIQTFLDAKGTERVRLGVDGVGAARFRLFDDEGAVRVAAVAFPADGSEAASRATLAVLGKGNVGGTSDQGGIYLSTTSDGTIQQSIYDRNGKDRVELGAYGDDALFLAFDQEATRRYGVGVMANGVVSQEFYDKGGINRQKTVVVPAGTDTEGAGAAGYVSQMMLDQSGTLRIDASTYNDGQASSDMRDASGRLRLSSASFADGNTVHRHFDADGRVKLYSGTFSDGQSGQVFLASDGTTKASTTVAQDDSLAYYVEKSAAERIWEGAGAVLQAIDIGERLGIIPTEQSSQDTEETPDE